MLLDLYLSRIPSAVKQLGGNFIRPFAIHANRKSTMVFWRQYRTELEGMVKNMMADASIKYTNHSLRATGATTLVDSGVPEAIIQKCTGHHSTKALRMYERVTSSGFGSVKNFA